MISSYLLNNRVKGPPRLNLAWRLQVELHNNRGARMKFTVAVIKLLKLVPMRKALILVISYGRS